MNVHLLLSPNVISVNVSLQEGVYVLTILLTII